MSTYKMYQVIEGYTMENFTLLVSMEIRKGWKPAGGLVIGPRDGGRVMYYQALYKEPIKKIDEE